MTRGALSWRLTVPDDGHMPGGGTIPHVIEWDARRAALGADGRFGLQPGGADAGATRTAIG